MKICSISGTPRTIQTITFEMAFTILKRLIEQNAIGRPSGAPHSSVTAKISRDIRKPSNRNAVTSKNDIVLSPNGTQVGQSPTQRAPLRIIFYFWSEKSVMAVLETP